MVAAAVLASLFAQAEPAPAEPAPAPAGPAEPAPAPPGPAEPAPVPVAPAPPEPKLANALVVSGRLAYRVGPEAERVGPSLGFAIGGSYERRYLQLADILDLGVALDFSFARFATAVTRAELPPGAAQPYDDTRALNQTTFAVMQTATLMLKSVRPFAAAGVGGSVSFFSTPELALSPGSMTATQPLARASVGVEVPLSKVMSVTVAGEITHAFTRPTYRTNDGQTYSFLGDALTGGAGLRLRF